MQSTAIPDGAPVSRTDEIELADDGSPLGTLMVDGRVYTPGIENGGVPVKTQAEKDREALEDITGETDFDTGLIELYEGYSDPILRRRALELYVKEGRSLDEVAKALSVPVTTVEMWAYNGKWNRAAGHAIAVRAQEEARGLAALRIRVRQPIIENQLEGARRIRERVLKEMDTLSIKSAAEALKAAADVEARALGMSESGAISGAEEDEMARKAKGDGKTPLVLVVNNAGSASGILPVRRPAEIIEVTAK